MVKRFVVRSVVSAASFLVAAAAAAGGGGGGGGGGASFVRSRRSTTLLRRRGGGENRRRSTGPMFMSGLFGEQSIFERRRLRKESRKDWDIYVDQSKASLDRGGGATLDAFCGLAPSSKVEIFPAILPPNYSRRVPWVRCVSNVPGRNSLDVGNVDSVDKVYRVLTEHLKLEKVSMEACECLKWKYKGNSHLEAGKIDLAIDAYDKSLGKCEDEKQEAVVLLLRASAYLQQAQSQKEILQSIVEEWGLLEMGDVRALARAVFTGGSELQAGLARSLLTRLKDDGIRQQAELRKVQYRHGLYQFSLLNAAKDSLRSTELLPSYSTSWLRSGELLGELWKLKESRQYYERALALDASLGPNLVSIMKGIERRQDLLDMARATKEWPEDSLRLALDIAG